jgi:ADP-heptose:LPS heptosyltransferase
MSLNTYIIEGGLGKHIMFTALIDQLVEKTGEPIQVHTPYVQVFAGNPKVKMAFDSVSIPLDDPRILESDEIIYCEPYKSNFVKGDEHLLESYCKHLGIEYNPKVKPEIFTDFAKADAKKWLEQFNITGKFILIQMTGGQSPIGTDLSGQYVSSNAGRNYPPYFTNGLCEMIKQKYPDYTIIDCTLSNEPAYPFAIKCDAPWQVVNELLKMSEGFIAIDSCLQHMGAAEAVPGVVVWGNTRWNQFGWEQNKNVSFNMKEINDRIKIDINDPRNIMVGPEFLFNVYEIMKRDKNEFETVECAHL